MKTNSQNVGKKVTVLANQVGVPVGTISKVVRMTGGGNNYVIEAYPNNSLLKSEIKIAPLTKEDIELEIAELNSEIVDLNLKKEFMNANNLTEFDENQYKVFKTLTTLENKDLSSIEKSKIIASLLES